MGTAFRSPMLCPYSSAPLRHREIAQDCRRSYGSSRTGVNATLCSLGDAEAAAGLAQGALPGIMPHRAARPRILIKWICHGRVIRDTSGIDLANIFRVHGVDGMRHGSSQISAFGVAPVIRWTFLHALVHAKGEPDFLPRMRWEEVIS
jgi:hypothetical protein